MHFHASQSMGNTNKGLWVSRVFLDILSAVGLQGKSEGTCVAIKYVFTVCPSWEMLLNVIVPGTVLMILLIHCVYLEYYVLFFSLAYFCDFFKLKIG